MDQLPTSVKYCLQLSFKYWLYALVIKTKYTVSQKKRTNFETVYVQFERRKVDKKANLHENWSMQTLF